VSKHWRKPVGPHRSGLNPIRTTPPCYNNTTLGNCLYAQCKGPNVTNPICLTCKNCSHKCAVDCEHCVSWRPRYMSWPNFGEISSNIYEDIVFTRFYRSLPAVTLTFKLWSCKLVSTTNPNTSVTKIGWKSLHWFVRYGVHKVFESLRAVTMTFDLFIPNTSVTKIGWNPRHLFLRYGVHKIFGTHRLTHSLTHRWTDPNAVYLQHHFSMVAEA